MRTPPRQRVPPPPSLLASSLDISLGFSESAAGLAHLKGKVEVDHEVGGDRDGPGRHVAEESFQDLHVFGPACQHVLGSALPDNVVLRPPHSLQTQSIGLAPIMARFLPWRCLS